MDPNCFDCEIIRIHNFFRFSGHTPQQIALDCAATPLSSWPTNRVADESPQIMADVGLAVLFLKHLMLKILEDPT